MANTFAAVCSANMAERMAEIAALVKVDNDFMAALSECGRKIEHTAAQRALFKEAVGDSFVWENAGGSLGSNFARQVIRDNLGQINVIYNMIDKNAVPDKFYQEYERLSTVLNANLETLSVALNLPDIQTLEPDRVEYRTAQLFKKLRELFPYKAEDRSQIDSQGYVFLDPIDPQQWSEAAQNRSKPANYLCFRPPEAA